MTARFPPASVRPLRELPPSTLAGVRGVLTDIDDTLTCNGVVEAEAGAALQRLADAGLPVLAITGRPMGWSEPFARDWPVAAVVAENGALAWLREAGMLRIEYLQDAATRAHHARRLREVAARLLRDVPAATLARDRAGRVTDIAIDHAEFATLDASHIAQVVALMRDQGLALG